MIQLSILIPSIPSRFSQAQALYEKLLALVGDRSIEILLFCDNKKRTIGEKREVLKNMSQGKYFMFCDDDDEILSLDSLYEASFRDVDVITFKQRCLNQDKSTFVVTFGLGNPIEHNHDGAGHYLDSKRPPFHVCAWSSSFKNIPFGFVNYAEDWVFAGPANQRAKTEVHLDEIIHSYNFDLQTSEATTENNHFWTNPNVLNERPEARSCIVNLATGQGRYQFGQSRLTDSLRTHWDRDYFLFTEEAQVGAPLHADNPYAFKIYAIEKMRKMEYERILWLDASVVAIKNPKPVFDWMEDKGLFLEEAGHMVGSWCNPETLEYFKITREQAMQMPMFSAGYCGFDFRTSIAKEFFAEWKEAMNNGMFKGSWDNHRHDMTVGSIIANLRGYNKLYSPGGQFFAYIGPAYSTPLPSVVCHLMGI